MQPYQERLLNEYVDLYDKREKLVSFIARSITTLDFKLNYDLGLLTAQRAVMDSYLSILKLRIQQENLQTEFEECMYKFFKSNEGSLYGTVCKKEDQGI